MTNMIQICSNFYWGQVFILETRPDEMVLPPIHGATALPKGDIWCESGCGAADHFRRTTKVACILNVDFISHNVFIDEFEKVNNSTTSSTYCLLLLIRIVDWQFCGGIDFLKRIIENQTIECVQSGLHDESGDAKRISY